MTDPNLNNFEAINHDHETQRSTSSFQRIQVNRPQRQAVREYHELPRPSQQELLSRLIDHVRTL